MSGDSVDKGDERQALIKATRDWGYYSSDIPALTKLFRGKRVLDVGMGGGPHAVRFIESGATAYVGVDPRVGSDRVRDFRNIKDPSITAYHAFPFSATDIERIYPGVKLYSAILEDVIDQVKAFRPDLAVMVSVTEHLHQIDSVMDAIWKVLPRDGLLWANHQNYYSWSGHHAQPRDVASWDRNNPAHNSVVDWQHLDPGNRYYSHPTLNRIRLEDLRVVVAKYFELQSWEPAIDARAIPRLTPEIRNRWSKYSLAELLTRTVVIIGKRRDVPLDIDFKDRQLTKPDEQYLAHRSYLDEDIARYSLAYNRVYFYKERNVVSHSTNDFAGRQIFDRLKDGDPLTVRKEGERYTFTVDKVIRPNGSPPMVQLTEPVPEALRGENASEWTIEL